MARSYTKKKERIIFDLDNKYTAYLDFFRSKTSKTRSAFVREALIAYIDQIIARSGVDGSLFGSPRNLTEDMTGFLNGWKEEHPDKEI